MAGMSGRAVIVHSLDHALAALAAAARMGCAVTLLSPPRAAAYMGPLLFMSIVEQARARHPAVPADAVLDCGDRAGDALAALRQGVPAIRFAGRADVADKLAAIAAQRGQRVLTDDVPALDLLHRADPGAALALWLDNVAKD
jgi:acyl-CoA reductase-like NAD-dependent aldehyde dehydrogenase